jgi:uncharacterized protein YndB with AHSA1/START domain
MEINYTLPIDAPVETVFELIDDDQQNLLWMEGLIETVCLAPFDRANPVGKTFLQRLKFGAMAVEYRGEVTHFHRPERIGLAVEDKAGNYRMEIDYRFSPTADGGTRLEYASRTTALSASGKAMVAGLRLVAKRMLIAQMNRLRSVAESAPKEAAGGRRA